MNNSLIALVFVFASVFNVSSQHDVDFYGTLYRNQEVDTFPVYPGGYFEFMDYMSFNFRVNQSMQGQIGNGLQSVVFTFVVDTSGNTFALQVRNCPSSHVQKEFQKIFDKMSGWKPAIHNGEKVALQVDLMLDFRIEDMQIICYPQSSKIVSPRDKKKRPMVKATLIVLAISIPIFAIISTEKK